MRLILFFIIATCVVSASGGNVLAMSTDLGDCNGTDSVTNATSVVSRLVYSDMPAEYAAEHSISYDLLNQSAKLVVKVHSSSELNLSRFGGYDIIQTETEQADLLQAYIPVDQICQIGMENRTLLIRKPLIGETDQDKGRADGQVHEQTTTQSISQRDISSKQLTLEKNQSVVNETDLRVQKEGGADSRDIKTGVLPILATCSLVVVLLLYLAKVDD